MLCESFIDSGFLNDFYRDADLGQLMLCQADGPEGSLAEHPDRIVLVDAVFTCADALVVEDCLVP